MEEKGPKFTLFNINFPKIGLFKLPTWLLKSLNRREKVNYSFDVLVGTFVLGGIWLGQAGRAVNAIMLILGLIMIAGCYIYTQVANRLRW